jgi:hypothetical protein
MDLAAQYFAERLPIIAWYTLITSQIVLFTGLVVRRMWRRYPMLATFALTLLLQSLVTVPFGGGWQSGTEPLIWIAQCATLCEITRALVLEYAQLAKFAQRFTIACVGTVGTLFALGFAEDILPAFLMAAQLLVLVSLLLTFRVLPRPIPRNVSRHTRVMTVYMGIQLARYSAGIHGEGAFPIAFALAEAACYSAWVLAVRPAGECIPCPPFLPGPDLRTVGDAR